MRRPRRTPPEQPEPEVMTTEQLYALALIAEQIAGTSYDLAMAGQSRERVVQAAIAAVAHLAENPQELGRTLRATEGGHT